MSACIQSVGPLFFETLMQYAAHIYLWTECWSDREVGLFDRAKALGIPVAVGGPFAS